ncbi:DUF6339 family protein [Bacillus testis]|uniref:DUF6339 family protein n=1 Tax=Bacillus testis TaxID=1622072 RepID=UPI000A9B5335|nr:DUF6339 family protein [Bacillus testis]
MKLQIISEDTLQDLRVNYKAYSPYYHNIDDEWFNSYFAEEGRIIETKIDVELPEMNMDDSYAISDKDNVKKVYTALKHLTIVQATQERLWSGLAHLQMRDYSFYRLREELKKGNDNRINTGLFFKNGNKRSLFVHVLARLWWVGYMTYDENNHENPYWLTDFFCESDFSARSVLFFSSNFTANRPITVGILKALIRLKESGVSIKRDHFVQATKYLNVVGGAMVLDVLDADEVEEMVFGYLMKYYHLEQCIMVDSQV